MLRLFVKADPVAPELHVRSNRVAGDRFAGLERGSALDSLRGSGNMESTGHSQQLTETTGCVFLRGALFLGVSVMRRG